MDVNHGQNIQKIYFDLLLLQVMLKDLFERTWVSEVKTTAGSEDKIKIYRKTVLISNNFDML